MSENEAERRTSNRARRELRVEYAQLNEFFSDYTHNISRGGMFIRTEEALPSGSEIEFSLRVPTVDEPLLLRGLVRWTIEPDKASSGQPAGMGIAFVYDSEDHRRRTHAQIEALMEDTLGSAAAILLGD